MDPLYKNINPPPPPPPQPQPTYSPPPPPPPQCSLASTATNSQHIYRQTLCSIATETICFIKGCRLHYNGILILMWAHKTSFPVTRVFRDISFSVSQFYMINTNYLFINPLKLSDKQRVKTILYGSSTTAL